LALSTKLWPLMGVHPVIALENKVSTKPGRKHFDAK